MLRELHVENFKAWRELSMEFGKVTALFGENSAGKSSLMQFLLMLKQTKNAGSFELRVGQAVCGLSVWKSSLPAMRKKAMRMVSNRL